MKTQEAIKTTDQLTVQLLADTVAAQHNPLPSLATSQPSASRETLRHILLGTPGAIQQTIHLLHNLRYAETVLWSPTMTIEEPLIITPAKGEAISLLRRQL